MREVQVRDQPASASTLLALLGVAVLLPVLVIALLILPVWAALVVSVVAAAVASWIAWSRATTTVRRLSGGSPADPVRHARLLNIVDGLCLAAGVQAPNVDVVEDAAANALVAGRSERDAVIVVTSGLLEALDRVELEGAIAHQLVQLRDPSLGSATVAVTTVGLPVLLADRLGRTGGSGQRRPRPIRLGVGVDRQT